METIDHLRVLKNRLRDDKRKRSVSIEDVGKENGWPIMQNQLSACKESRNAKLAENY